jgi:hypothetical protein
MAFSDSLARRLGLTAAERRVLAKLDTPERVQDFVDRLPTNFELAGDSCLSVRGVLRERHAHCAEGAFLAAAALWLHGRPPLLLDLKAVDEDDDHVVVPFQVGRCWGAISKSNHVWLRWRDPVYRSLRELTMSWFHEYVLRERKTLRSYARPLDLRRVDPALWLTNEDKCEEVCRMLDEQLHYPLLSRAQEKRLRPRDGFERGAGRLTEYKPPNAALIDKY